MKHKIIIPADIPAKIEKEFIKNYTAITRETGRLFLFACDQKIEHLNKDFFGSSIHPDALYPKNLFTIAQQGNVGAMAAHLGLIDRYGKEFPDINYIVKITGKTNLKSDNQDDPISADLWDVWDVIEFKQTSKLAIAGIGITVYPGSEYENEMFSFAANQIHEAHKNGLVAIVWMYPRGKSIIDDRDADLLAGAAGIALSLGADFVKIKPPKQSKGLTQPELLKIITAAAGNTKVICSGGKKRDIKDFLTQLYNQLHYGNTSGCATGRNIFQHATPTAISIAKAIAAIVYDNVTIETASKHLV